MGSQVPSPQFETTLWHVVLRARDAACPDGAVAMGKLCEIYWYPLYAYARRRGLDPHGAEDLIQDLFAQLLARDFLKNVAPEYGRFRSFLLASLNNLLAEHFARDHALKRGGQFKFVSFDEMTAEQRYREEPAHQLQPDRLFDRRWALTLLERALAKLREDYEATEQGRQMFEALSGLLLDPGAGETYVEIGQRLGMSEGAVKMQAFRLRRRFQMKFQTEIANTLGDPSQLESEIAALLAALG